MQHQHFQENEIRFTAVSRIKQLNFGMQNWWTFKESAALAAWAFKVWKSLRKKVVLPVKRISYFLHSPLLSGVYKKSEKLSFENSDLLNEEVVSESRNVKTWHSRKSFHAHVKITYRFTFQRLLNAIEFPITCAELEDF